MKEYAKKKDVKYKLLITMKEKQKEDFVVFIKGIIWLML